MSTPATHVDAPIHWVSGKDNDDVSQIPAQRLVGPAVIIDKVAEVEADPDYCLTLEDVKAWEAEQRFSSATLLGPVSHGLVALRR